MQLSSQTTQLDSHHLLIPGGVLKIPLWPIFFSVQSILIQTVQKYHHVVSMHKYHLPQKYLIKETAFYKGLGHHLKSNVMGSKLNQDRLPNCHAIVSISFLITLSHAQNLSCCLVDLRAGGFSLKMLPSTPEVPFHRCSLPSQSSFATDIFLEGKFEDCFQNLNSFDLYLASDSVITFPMAEYLIQLISAPPILGPQIVFFLRMHILCSLPAKWQSCLHQLYANIHEALHTFRFPTGKSSGIAPTER